MRPTALTLLTELVVDRVIDTVDAREAGHCMRVEDLPINVIRAACERLTAELGPGASVYLVTRHPSLAYERDPGQIVELRNASETAPDEAGVLVVFVPPNERLAAEDSIGSTTFERIVIDDLEQNAYQEALQRLGKVDLEIRRTVESIADLALSDSVKTVDPTHADATSFVLNIVESLEQDPDDGQRAVGYALTDLGLLPDSQITELEPEGLRRRLQINGAQMNTLCDTVDPNARVSQLALGDDAGGIGRALVESLPNGISDRETITQQLRERAEVVDFANWEIAGGEDLPVRSLEIRGLVGFTTERKVGGIKEKLPEPLIDKEQASIGVKFDCDPPLVNYPDSRLKIEVLELGRSGTDQEPTGFQFSKKSPMAATKTGTFRKKLRFGESEDADLPPGLYLFRLSLIGRHQETLKSTESAQNFRVGPVDSSVDSAPRIASALEALAQSVVASGKSPDRLERIATIQDGHLLERLLFRSPSSPKPWAIDVNERLAQMEADLLKNPRTRRAMCVDLGKDEIDPKVESFDESIDGISEFLEARSSVFQQISSIDNTIQGITGIPCEPNVWLTDLTQARDAIEDYVDVWCRSLRSASLPLRKQLLETDRLTVNYEYETAFVLLAPTHPVRLAWNLAMVDEGETWIAHAGQMDLADLLDEARELVEVLPSITGSEMPLVVTAGETALRYRSVVGSTWGLWVNDRLPDVDRVETRLLDWVGSPSSAIGQSVGDELFRRLKAYVDSHPYVDTLVVNAIRPGTGEVLLRLLARLLEWRLKEGEGELSFDVRLFSEYEDASTLGRAFDDFMLDPEESKLTRTLADLLSRPSGNPLRPTLSFSKQQVDDLRTDPGRFGAHVSLFLDFFDSRIVPVHTTDPRRSIYCNGLVCSPVSSFKANRDRKSGNPTWTSTLTVDSGGRNLVERAIAAQQHGVIRSFETFTPTSVPGLQLELTPTMEQLIDSVHRSSDWVIFVDRVFSDEYLDTEPHDDSNQSVRFVVDSRDSSDRAELHNVVVSAQMKQEQAAPMAEAASEFGLDLTKTAYEKLLNGLQLLGAGLGLRLIVDGTKRKEALSLALAALYLQERGVLRHALVIPMDEHMYLFRDAQNMGETDSLTRSDLMVVRLDPDPNERQVNITLVEVKVRAGLGGQLSPEFTNSIVTQLTNTETVVRKRLFAAHLRKRRFSLPAALRTQRLIGLFRARVARAVRYEFVDPSEADSLDEFINSMDRRFDIVVNRMGLVLDPAASESRIEEFDEVRVHVIGKKDIDRVLNSPEQVQTESGSEGEYLLTVLGAGGETTEVPALLGTSEDPDPEVEEVLEPVPPLEATEVRSIEWLDADEVDIVGQAQQSAQYGIIGTQWSGDGRDVALDVNGTNVISLFGVQGSGKSFTTGSIVEAGLIQEPRLGKLTNQLATVVFHYSRDMSVKCEYGSMSEPSDDESSIEWLRERGVEPATVDEVVVLVPSGQEDQRRADYPGCTVETLAIGTAELSGEDWKLLMGIAGGEQMYARQMQRVLGDLRSEISLSTIRAGIEEAGLTANQKRLAETRLGFCQKYVRDDARVSDVLKPGRLVIVDIRDSYIDQPDALSVFMVLLNCFSGAGRGETKFNKMIVFDEAHKYMKDTRLADEIGEAVREMRKKGVTIVIASQDPVAVPRIVLELSTVVIAHRMESDKWGRALREAKIQFSGVDTSRLAQLNVGEAFLWSGGGAARYRTPERVSMRPRLTRHGGGTIQADD